MKPSLYFGETIRTSIHHLIKHRDGHIELYDHRSTEAETKNIASEFPQLASVRKAQLEARLALRSN